MVLAFMTNKHGIFYVTFTMRLKVAAKTTDASIAFKKSNSCTHQNLSFPKKCCHEEIFLFLKKQICFFPKRLNK